MLRTGKPSPTQCRWLLRWTKASFFTIWLPRLDIPCIWSRSRQTQSMRTSIVRRNFLAGTARFCGHGLQLLAQADYFLLQLIDLFLLPIHRLIQFLEQVLAQTQLGFDFFEA